MINSGLLAGKTAAIQAMFLGMPLVTRRPKVEQDERHKHVKGDVQVAHVDVRPAGEDQRIYDAAGG